MKVCLSPICSIKCESGCWFPGNIFSLWVSEVVSVTQVIPRKIGKYTFSEFDHLRTYLASNSAMFRTGGASFLLRSSRHSAFQKYIYLHYLPLRNICLHKYLLSVWNEAPNAIIIRLILHIRQGLSLSDCL